MAATQEEQFKFLKGRMTDYFSRLAEISEKYAPPGENASNGFWRTETFEDQKLKDLETAAPIELSDDGAELGKIFSDFQAQVRTAFSNDNYEAEWPTNIGLAWTVFKDHVKDILTVVTDIFDIFDKDKKTRDEARDKVFNDIEKLVKDVENSKNKSKGKHANGHISEVMQGGATAAKVALDQKFPQSNTSDLGKLASSLRAVCEKIIPLDTKDHKPWLRAEWQIAFQGITRGAATGLAA